jgi:hypothetical protein
MKKHIIIYSHGFAVRKDDLGLFTDIAQAIPEAESILFDYYKINEIENTITVCPPSVQVKMLNKVIKEAKLSNPGAIIDLICHSQGTIIAALAKPEGIRKIILISAIFDMGLERSLERYRSKPGVEINLDGVSKIPSSTGLTKIIPAQYWRERVAIKPFEEYNAFAEKTDMIVINANQDQVLPKVDLKELNPKIKVIQLDGNHDFGGEDRKKLIEVVKEEIKL